MSKAAWVLKDNAGSSIWESAGWVFCKPYNNHIIKLGYLSGKTLIMERSSAKHFFHRIKGYGFNALCLQKVCIDKGRNICLDIDGKVRYWLDPKVLLDLGDFLHFKNEGYERQVFISLEDIEAIAIKAEKTEDYNLF